MAVFIGDYFARGSKRSGAWCSAMRSQKKLGGDVRPIVVNVCNFAKGDPALLSYDDARTLFHEFGHALHQMLSDVTYGSISGTSVARDFVELPSQLYEHWLEVPEVLQKHARHAETGEAMPQDLLDRLLAAQTYDMGFQTVEYVASALVDLDFHDGAAPADPMAAQAGTLAARHAARDRDAPRHAAFRPCLRGRRLFQRVLQLHVVRGDGRRRLRGLRGGGDAFDPRLAGKLETHILSAGGSREAELYTAFRGGCRGRGAAEGAGARQGG
jgi:peptidyl-dipeptidase Dcp